MLALSTALLVSLLGLVNGAPAPFGDADIQAIARRTSPGIPDDIPGPVPGQCSLLIISQSLLPLGSAPTSASGEGIGPSEQGEPQVVVINMGKDVVGGPATLEPQSPGFAASMPLSDLIVDAQTVSVTADYIDVGAKDWGVKYSYAGIDYDCGGVCLEYSEYVGVFGVYNVHQGFFPC